MFNELLTLTHHQTVVSKRIQNIKKDNGIFFTPERIVDFMVSLIDHDKYNKKDKVKILEPACGLTQFIVGIKRNLPALFKKASIWGVEKNPDIISYLSTLKIADNLEIYNLDYLLWQPNNSFDLIIGNPPYGIPSLSEHYTIKVDAVTKEKYKNSYETWYGKYNVYGAFIEKSIKLLNQEGQLIFIIPATFMILDEFKKLRDFLSRHGRTRIIYFGSDVFKPEANVSAVILDFYKSNKFAGDLKLLEYRENQIYPIKINRDWKGEVVLFETEYTELLKSVCSYRLGDVYEISISPRTPEIKHNPDIKQKKPINGNGYYPLLNGRNLKCHKISYDNRTGCWIKKSDAKRLRGYFGIPHIVVGLGFRENGKVAAAYDERCYPWMGDVYHLLKKSELFTAKFDLSDTEILDYLNSDYLKKYIKETYREITYHLSITQLKSIPIPSKKEWQEIKRILASNIEKSTNTNALSKVPFGCAKDCFAVIASRRRSRRSSRSIGKQSRKACEAGQSHLFWYKIHNHGIASSLHFSQ